MRKSIGDGRGEVSAARVELRGVPLFAFRFAPIKQLRLQGVRITVHEAGDLSGTSSSVVAALGPSSAAAAISAVLVDGFEIRFEPRDTTQGCSIAATHARWSPSDGRQNVTMTLQGSVRLRIGNSERATSFARVTFRHDGIEVSESVARSEDGGSSAAADPFCRVVS